MLFLQIPRSEDVNTFFNAAVPMHKAFDHMLDRIAQHNHRRGKIT